MMSPAHLNMIDGQLRPNRINDPALLAAFTAVEREAFVPTEQAAYAYADRPLPLPGGRELMSPLGLAHLLDALSLKPEDHLLILAGNTGYSAAIASNLVGHVTLVEDNADLLKIAATNLTGPHGNHGGITVVRHNPATFTPHQAHEAVLLDSTITMLPAHAHTWVKEGGTIAAVTANPTTGLPTQTTYTRHGHTLFATAIAETQGTPHPAFTEAPGFVF